MSFRSLLFDHAYLPHGWAQDVRVVVDGGNIVSVESDVAGASGERVPGIALPGLPNLHCHAFQRAMAGLAEKRGPAYDSFWTWREIMYLFLDNLSPDDVEAITTFAYMDMLERGFTAVGEFHYLHHAPDGSPYADIGEMTTRIASAAAESGIGLTLLPSFYAQGGFGGTPAARGQRRFLNDPERFAELVVRARKIASELPSATVGIAPHSLRAVTPESMKIVVSSAPEGPIHIHAAEQIKEVEDCVAWSGRRPVEWLLDELNIDGRWCLIHATHMTSDETVRLANSGAVAGLCPLTEASLGDGIFNGFDFLTARGRFGVGSDSNIEIDAAAELRQLEYSQRLARRARNVMTTREGESNGCSLFSEVIAGGAQALGRPIGAIAAGHRADIVVLDRDHADFCEMDSGRWLDAWIFVAGRSAIDSVFAGGTQVVGNGRHFRRDAIATRYRAIMKKFTNA